LRFDFYWDFSECKVMFCYRCFRTICPSRRQEWSLAMEYGIDRLSGNFRNTLPFSAA